MSLVRSSHEKSNNNKNYYNLLDKVINNDIKEVQKLICSNDINLTLLDDDNCSLTYHAAINENWEIFHILITNGSDINTSDSVYNISPIHLCAYYGNLKAINTLISLTKFLKLISLDVLLNVVTKYENATPLYISSDYGYLNIVTSLIKNGANLNQADNNGSTPLYIASKNGHFEIVKELINANACINQTNNDNMTPLCIANRNSHTNIVNFLILNGANGANGALKANADDLPVVGSI